MRLRTTLAATTAGLLLASAAAAAPRASWSYDGADGLPAGAPGEIGVEVTVEEPGLVREDRPLGYRHFLLDADGEPQSGEQVGWSYDGRSGTATVDGDGAILLPPVFTLADTPALTSGDTSTLELSLPAGDYVLFSDLVDRTPPTVRRAGDGRYTTAVEVSRTTFPPDTDTVFVATGESFADALAAGPAAAKAGGPLLLVPSTSVPQIVRDELRRLAPSQIVVVGGTAVVSEDVERELQPYADDVRRIAGIDRFDTAARVARFMYPITGDETVDRAYVANGRSFPDALGAAARAAIDGLPVLLVEQDAVPQATETTIDVLGIDHVTVAGGSAAVSPATYTELRSIAGAATRRSGPDRYATSAAIADRDGEGRTLLVATGQNFPDALTATPVAGWLNADLLLTTPDALPDRIADRAAELAPRRVIVLGGTAAVGDDVKDALDALRTELTPLYLEPVVAGGEVDVTVGPGIG